MTGALSPSPPIESYAPRPLIQRVRDTFVSPARLFAAFGDNPPWIGALALATVVAAAAIGAEPAEFYLDQMEDPVDRRGQPVEITSPPEQIVLWGRLMAIFSAMVGHPMLAFAGAGILTLVFRVIGRGESSFRQYLAVASHGLLILSLGMLATVFLRALTGNADALPTFGSLVGADESGFVGRVLHGINLFTVWMLTVVALGVAAVDERVTRVQSAALLWGGYAVLIVTGALLFRG